MYITPGANSGCYWGGLEPSSATKHAMMDGSVGHSNWWYAVGAYQRHDNAIPAWCNVVRSSVELWSVYPETNRPTPRPTPYPTNLPTPQPTFYPSPNPTPAPSWTPSLSPSESPTNMPTTLPTSSPTALPTDPPTSSPTSSPSNDPTAAPSSIPSHIPSESPTNVPTTIPTSSPTEQPTNPPTSMPTSSPTNNPTQAPSWTPSQIPSESPTGMPTTSPTSSESPTNMPTISPTYTPTEQPTDPANTLMNTIHVIMSQPIYVSFAIGTVAVLCCFITVCLIIRKHNRSAKSAATVCILERTVVDGELQNIYPETEGTFGDIPSPPGFMTPTSKGNYSTEGNQFIQWDL